MTRAWAIRLQGASRSFAGQSAVKALTLDLAPGRVTALLGASGSGKSTVLRMIAGLEPVDAGAVLFDNEIVSEPGRMLKPQDRAIGLVFQDFALFPHLTARANVAFGLNDWPKPARLREADRLLELVGLSGKAAAFPHQLSGGEQQRVALARAVAPKPRALLLDEPFSGLDPALRADLRDTTLAMVSEIGATAVFVTHDAEEALYVADELAILSSGALVQAGPPRAVYRKPASPTAAAALGPINTLEGVAAGGVFTCALGALPAPGAADGAGIGVIRVEAVELGAAGGAQAKILARRAQGAQDSVIVEAKGARLRAHIDPNADYQPGDDVAVRVAHGALHVFPVNA